MKKESAHQKRLFRLSRTPRGYFWMWFHSQLREKNIVDCKSLPQITAQGAHLLFHFSGVCMPGVAGPPVKKKKRPFTFL